MAQTKQEIQSLLSAAGSAPRHRFGQNFMIDQNLVRLIADEGRLAPGDLAIEVGPGTGTLTEELLARGARVVGVEIDRDLAALLRRRFADQPRFSLLEGDALAGKHAINAELRAMIARAAEEGTPRRLVANLPYQIASPLIIELLIAGMDSLTFTVQKEVAYRLRATPNSDAYGPLSVMAQMLAEVEILRTLPPQAFWPPPSIDSALVRMVRHDRLGQQAASFSSVVHTLFSYRRKTLRRALIHGGYDAEAALAATGMDGALRPEAFGPEDLLSLHQALSYGK